MLVADTCDRCTRSLTLTWYVPDHDLCYNCFSKENSSAPWYAYDTPVSEVRCNGCAMMIEGIKYTPATNLCHGCFSQIDDLEHAPYRLTNAGSFPLQPGSPVSSCRLEQSCESIQTLPFRFHFVQFQRRDLSVETIRKV